MTRPQEAELSTPSYLIDGSATAKQVRSELKDQVASLKACGIVPRLGVILVGGHPPSQIYVKYKRQAALEVGIEVIIHPFPENVQVEELYRCVDMMNEDPSTHGILVQLPLPTHISSARAWSVVERVLPHKDVDGLHPLNQGLIGTSSSPEQPLSAGLIACTPLGCLRLLTDRLGALDGKIAAVVGRSRIVGRPMAALLTAAHATVTLCHSRTSDLTKHLKEADIIVAAAGIPRLIGPEHVSPKATVIDVGIHRLDSGKLCGDVQFDAIKDHVEGISPVPKGVGPMTIASLLSNVCLAAKRQSKM